MAAPSPTATGARFGAARWVALATPALLLGGALGSQYLGGLYPCEMCHWQRWPHYAALVLAALAFVPAPAGSDRQRQLVALAALAIAVSGAIGLFHAGVEYGWWQGVTGCTTTLATPAGGSTADLLKAIMNAPLIRCDQAQWTLFGVSLAGFNALFSFAAALAITVLLRRRGPVAA